MLTLFYVVVMIFGSTYFVGWFVNSMVLPLTDNSVIVNGVSVFIVGSWMVGAIILGCYRMVVEMDMFFTLLCERKVDDGERK